MSCIFCESLFHLSQYCDIFISNVDRKKIVIQTHRCVLCLNSLGNNLGCENGTCNPKCYICFSRDHHTVYCPYRFTAPYMFIDNLDIDLLPRFMQMLDIEEHQILAFSYPVAYNLLKLKPMVVRYEKQIHNQNIEHIPNFYTVVTKNVEFHSSLQHRIPTSTESSILETMIFKLEKVSLCFIPFSGRELLRFLSAKTKTFYCNFVTFSSTVKLIEILKKVPNVESLHFKNTNIQLSDLWPEELMKWSCKNLKYISFEFFEINCNVQSLANLMKVKTNIKIFIYLKVHTDVPLNQKRVLQNVSSKIINFFLPVNCFVQNGPCLFISFVNESDCARNSPRKEGFLKVPRCVPGDYTGSCLLILPEQTLNDAYQSCHLDYGGRLATAKTKNTLQLWIRTIHFDPKINIDADSRFWIGYGKSGFKKGFHKRRSEKVYEDIWKNILPSDEFYVLQNDDWDKDAHKELLDDLDCNPDHAAAFNPNTKKFDVILSNENVTHLALCEIPRDRDYQCESGWQAIHQLKICVKVYGENMSFNDAHKTCRQENALVSTAKDDRELEIMRDVIIPYKFRNGLKNIGGFWAGIKSEGAITFALDGSAPLLTVDQSGIGPTDKFCCAFTFRSFRAIKDTATNEYEDMQGLCVDCNGKNEPDISLLPFMCEKGILIMY